MGSAHGLPGALLARRRRCWWFAALLMALWIGLFVQDVVAGIGYGEADEGEFVVEGTVVGRDDGLQVRYVHPMTDQEVVASVWVSTLDEPAQDSRVELVATADPMVVELLGDRWGPAVNWYVYVWIAVLAVLVILWGWLQARAARRAVRRNDGAVPMIGVVATANGLRHPGVRLHLYDLDARAGDPSRSSYRLASLPAVGLGRPFAVQVHEPPRPRRWLAAAAGGAPLWPLARVSTKHAMPLPPGPLAEPMVQVPVERPARGLDRGAVWSTLKWPAVATCVAAVVAVASAVVVLNLARSAAQFDDVAQYRIAEVVAHRADFTIVELEVLGDDRTVVVNDPLADEHPIGTRYPVLVDPDPGNRTARFLSEPYKALDVWIWFAVPLLAALAWLVVRSGSVRRMRRRAAAGPWHSWTVEVIAGDRSDSAVLVDALGAPIAAVPLGVRAPYTDVSVMTLGRRSMIIAGPLGPSEPAAIWPSAQDAALPARPMRVPELPAVLGERPSTAPVGVAAQQVPLARPLVGRSPTMWVDHDRIELVLPIWFGRRRWSIALDQVAVHDLTRDDPSSDPFEDEVVFTRPVVVPFVNMTTTMSVPTLALYFREPQRVPPLRWTMAFQGLGWRRSRSVEGQTVDGVQLLVKHPGPAVDALAGAGVEVVEDPMRWWRRHREVVRDRAERDRVVRSVRRIRILRGLGYAFGAVTLAVGWIWSGSAEDLAVPFVVPAVLSAVCFWAAALLDRRT
jgi:hypothetical protein